MYESNKIIRTLKYHFGKPEPMTWSFLLLVASVFAGLFFAAKCALNGMGIAVPTTSLVGYSIFMPIFVFFTFVFPAFLLKEGRTSSLVGNYTGSGILIIAVLSGLPLMLLSTVLCNIVIWGFLRGGAKILYPAFFYYGGTSTKTGLILGILTDGIIPAFGMSMFFFGILWSRFRFSQRRLAYIVIIIAYTLFSMDVTSVLSSIVVAWWCCKLRDKTDGVYAPFLCLVSSRICEILFKDILSKIDIYSIQTFSDVPSTYFYAALPTVLIAVILLGFFTRIFDDYYFKYMGREIPQDDESLPNLTRNLNFGLILAAVIMVVIWCLIAKGVHL